MPALTIVYSWEDNTGNISGNTLHAPLSLVGGGVELLAAQLAEAMEAVSTARLLSYDIRYSSGTLTSPGPSLDSDCTYYGLLLYRNGDDCSSFVVPSPSGVLFESGGPYGGALITRRSLALSGLLAQVDTILQGFLDPVGRPYGTVFIVGGRT